MNIIKTVADLQKALSAYQGDLPLDFIYNGQRVYLTTDVQIGRVTKPTTNQADYVEVTLIHRPLSEGVSQC